MPKAKYSSTVREAIKEGVKWANAKYGSGAHYMVSCTHEFSEGFIQAKYPTLTKEDSQAVLAEVAKRCKSGRKTR